MSHDQEKFNTSNYPTEHSRDILNGVDKKVFGKFKDEYDNEFVGLLSKLYVFTVGDQVTKKA